MTGSYRFGRSELRPVERRLLIDGQPAAIGARAFDLLGVLVEHRGGLVSKAELLDRVWPGLVVEENNLMVQVSTLRKLLGPDAIATIPGRGYRFTLPVAAGVEGAVAAGAAPAAAASSVCDPAPAPPPGNLPTRLPELYGRDDELRAVDALIAAHPLLSIVGAGGIGKTQLALAAAAAQRERHPDGSFCVELAPLADPAAVVAAVAQAVGMRSAADVPTAGSLVTVLRRSRMLLLLDNCEHLLDAVAALVAELLRECPGLRLLVTSQEPLKLADETVFRLGPLALPAGSGPVDAGAGAVALFVARAQAADRRLRFDEAALQQAVAICRRLDGLPLAIELAAARVPLLGLEGLARRLDERFDLLTGNSRFVMRRHQTLRAAYEWSHALLTDDEQVVFRRLAVFAGGFSLPLLQAVLGDERFDRWRLLDLLGHLVDKSLVSAESADPAAEPRYRLLESARAFALEQLAAAGETAELLQRHAQGVCTLLGDFNRRNWSLTAAEQAVRRAEIDNLRAAIDWAARADRRLASALFGAGRRVWRVHGQQAEAIRQGLSLLPLPDETPAAERALFELALADNGANSGRGECLAAARSAAAGFAALGWREHQMEALGALAVLAARRGDAATSGAAIEQARALIGPDTPALLLAEHLAWAGAWHRMADRSDEGLAGIERQRAAYAGLGAAGEPGVWIAETNIAAFLVDLGRYDEAIARLQRADTELQRRRIQTVDGWRHEHLCRAWLGKGELDAALACARDGMPAALREDNPRRLLRLLVLLHERRGDAVRAAQVAGFFEREMARLQWVLRPSDARAHTDAVGRLRHALGEAEYERLHAAGAELGLDRAVAVALGEAAPPSSSAAAC